MIGFYNHSVVLTYLSLVSSVLGITFAMDGKFLFALICLMVSGFCDLFDGRIARAMTGRTEDEKSFGIQIDSLCDLVCFTVLPAVISYCLGGNKLLALISGCCIILAGIIRLAYFNVMEIKRQREDPNEEQVYRGLPVTSTALIVPFIFIFRKLCGSYFITIYQLSLIVIAILFVLNFKIKKPGKKAAFAMTLGGLALAVAAVLTNI